MDNEVWKYINGTDGKYKISSLGRFLSVKRGTYMKVCCSGHGYAIINIPIGGKRQHYVHKLMASHFIENPNNLPQVHHIDADRFNYSLNNLMWCTQKYNVQIEYDSGRRVGKTNMKGLFGPNNPTSKSIIQMSIDGTPIRVIKGVKEAARIVNGCPSHIVKVCRGKLNKHAGYKWKYA